jgi:hypothetical protein
LLLTLAAEPATYRSLGPFFGAKIIWVLPKNCIPESRVALLASLPGRNNKFAKQESQMSESPNKLGTTKGVRLQFTKTGIPMSFIADLFNKLLQRLFPPRMVPAPIKVRIDRPNR